MSWRRGPGSGCCACTPRWRWASVACCWPDGTPERIGGWTGTMTPMTATTPPERERRPPATIARAALRAPFTRRARMELAYCLIGIPLGVAGFAAVAALLYAGALLTAGLVGVLVGVGALA